MAFRGFLGHPGAPWGFLMILEASWSILGTPEAFWSFLELFGASYDGLLKPPGASCGFLEPPGAYWSLLERPGEDPRPRVWPPKQANRSRHPRNLSPLGCENQRLHSTSLATKTSKPLETSSQSERERRP